MTNKGSSLFSSEHAAFILSNDHAEGLLFETLLSEKGFCLIIHGRCLDPSSTHSRPFVHICVSNFAERRRLRFSGSRGIRSIREFLSNGPQLSRELLKKIPKAPESRSWLLDSWSADLRCSLFSSPSITRLVVTEYSSQIDRAEIRQPSTRSTSWTYTSSPSKGSIACGHIHHSDNHP